MKIHQNVAITKLTTMRVGGKARYVLDITDPTDIAKAHDFAKEHRLPMFILGDGANTIGLDEGFAGVVLHNKIKGIKVLSECDESLTIVGMGGEKWDDVVEFVCQKGYSGIETLSLIPGTLGAAPVQNIGAYGQEVADSIVSVQAYDFIVSVTLTMQRGYLKPPFYKSLQEYLKKHKIVDYAPMSIRQAVINIRNVKLPDPAKIASAGSFFKNVYLSDAEADKAEKSGIPVYRKSGENKVNSGWLIEQCGLKGAEFHGMRVSDQAALILINDHTNKYSDLAAARDKIHAAVREKFGFELKQEPVEMKVDHDD